MKFNLEKVLNDDSLATGASKLFGMPDLAYNFDWPTVDVDGEQFDLEFLAQINLDELKLPELKGMLYLFYDLYAVCEGEISSDSVAVVYCPEHDELARCAFVSESGEADEDYDENATGVYKINFGEGSNAFLDENGNNVTLFSFDFPTTEYGLDGKRLTITISIQDLKKANFKNAVLSID